MSGNCVPAERQAILAIAIGYAETYRNSPIKTANQEQLVALADEIERLRKLVRGGDPGQFRHTGALVRDGETIAKFETDTEKFPKHVGELYVNGDWFTVEQARELRDFLNEVLP